MYISHTSNIRRLLMASLFVTLIALLIVGQLAAQETRSETEMACFSSQLNPDNDMPEALSDVTPDYLALMRHDGLDFDIFVQNRSTGVATQITNNTYEDYQPRIDGQYVVWEFENPVNATWDIALHNLTTGITQVISDSPREDRGAFIEGDHVVWARNGSTSSVVHYNIATGVTENVVVRHLNGHHFSVTGISDEKALYYHVGPSNNVHLNVYDIPADQITLVSEGVGESDRKYSSRIHGDVVVWQNENYGVGTVSAEIYVFHLGTQALTQLTNNDVADESPVAYGDYLVYHRTTDEGNEIHLHNLLSGVDEIIASSAVAEYDTPSIHRMKVAWHSTEGVYVYDIPSGQSAIASNYDDGYGLIVEDNLVYWNGSIGLDDVRAYAAGCGYAPQIGYQPQNTEIASGETAMLYVFATGDETLEYQWYQGDSNDTSTAIAGATTNTFVTPPLTQTTRYWVWVSNPFGSIESDRADVIVEGSVETPTPTPEGSIQLLTNTDFELDTDGDKIPDGWSAKGTTLDKSDKLKRNKLNEDGSVKAVAYTGEAAFMFRGNPDGQKSKLQYKLSDFGAIADGTALEFSVYVNRFNVTPGTTIGKVKINFSDGSKQTLQLTIPSQQGYTSVSDTLLVDLDGRAINKLRVEFSTNITGGKFMIDEASLLVIPGLTVTTAAEYAETDLLPLP